MPLSRSYSCPDLSDKTSANLYKIRAAFDLHLKFSTLETEQFCFSPKYNDDQSLLITNVQRSSLKRTVDNIYNGIITLSSYLVKVFEDADIVVPYATKHLELYKLLLSMEKGCKAEGGELKLRMQFLCDILLQIVDNKKYVEHIINEDLPQRLLTISSFLKLLESKDYFKLDRLAKVTKFCLSWRDMPAPIIDHYDLKNKSWILKYVQPGFQEAILEKLLEIKTTKNFILNDLDLLCESRNGIEEGKCAQEILEALIPLAPLSNEMIDIRVKEKFNPFLEFLFNHKIDLNIANEILSGMDHDLQLKVCVPGPTLTNVLSRVTASSQAPEPSRLIAMQLAWHLLINRSETVFRVLNMAVQQTQLLQSIVQILRNLPCISHFKEKVASNDSWWGNVDGSVPLIICMLRRLLYDHAKSEQQFTVVQQLCVSLCRDNPGVYCKLISPTVMLLRFVQPLARESDKDKFYLACKLCYKLFNLPNIQIDTDMQLSRLSQNSISIPRMLTSFVKKIEKEEDNGTRVWCCRVLSSLGDYTRSKGISMDAQVCQWLDEELSKISWQIKAAVAFWFADCLDSHTWFIDITSCLYESIPLPYKNRFTVAKCSDGQEHEQQMCLLTSLFELSSVCSEVCESILATDIVLPSKHTISAQLRHVLRDKIAVWSLSQCQTAVKIISILCTKVDPVVEPPLLVSLSLLSSIEYKALVSLTPYQIMADAFIFSLRDQITADVSVVNLLNLYSQFMKWCCECEASWVSNVRPDILASSQIPLDDVWERITKANSLLHFTMTHIALVDRAINAEKPATTRTPQSLQLLMKTVKELIDKICTLQKCFNDVEPTPPDPNGAPKVGANGAHKGGLIKVAPRMCPVTGEEGKSMKPSNPRPPMKVLPVVDLTGRKKTPAKPQFTPAPHGTPEAEALYGRPPQNFIPFPTYCDYHGRDGNTKILDNVIGAKDLSLPSPSSYPSKQRMYPPPMNAYDAPFADWRSQSNVAPSSGYCNSVMDHYANATHAHLVPMYNMAGATMQHVGGSEKMQQNQRGTHKGRGSAQKPFQKNQRPNYGGYGRANIKNQN